ncbi:MAG: M15 family metallopeptidase, partial [Nocardioidaceae bacterium]|nr:M15 family metallopeptidase [Nocardioidaceae bacterium]
PDGYGEVRRTPAELRDRRLPTRDLLRPPVDGRFHATVARIDERTRRRMGESWSPRCPVGISDLRLLTMGFVGFDGRAHTGRMVVNASVAGDVVSVFRTLFQARFPIEEMRLVTTADLRAAPTGDGNNTAAFVCRTTRAQTTWSAHAYGLAIDLDPFQNPYHRGDLVLRELASAYLDRSWHRPGMVLAGDVVTRAFARVGWAWGGDFRSVRDDMHFSETGR